MVTYHAPQRKYSRNMSADSLTRTPVITASASPRKRRRRSCRRVRVWTPRRSSACWQVSRAFPCLERQELPGRMYAGNRPAVGSDGPDAVKFVAVAARARRRTVVPPCRRECFAPREAATRHIRDVEDARITQIMPAGVRWHRDEPFTERLRSPARRGIVETGSVEPVWEWSRSRRSSSVHAERVASSTLPRRRSRRRSHCRRCRACSRWDRTVPGTRPDARRTACPSLAAPGSRLAARRASRSPDAPHHPRGDSTCMESPLGRLPVRDDIRHRGWCTSGCQSTTPNRFPTLRLRKPRAAVGHVEQRDAVGLGRLLRRGTRRHAERAGIRPRGHWEGRSPRRGRCRGCLCLDGGRRAHRGCARDCDCDETDCPGAQWPPNHLRRVGDSRQGRQRRGEVHGSPESTIRADNNTAR